ncbi:MAG: MraY family glycosyltransferase [Victivallaceae bacterium]|nr:MraY family glycosyltransferase [Victivallaceae bacterium]
MTLKWLAFYLAALTFPLLLSLVFTPLVRRAALRRGFMDRPKSEAHKQQSAPVALGGGMALMAAFITCLALGAAIAAIHPAVREELALKLNLELCMKRGAVLASAALAAGLLGLTDDLRPLKAWAKFLGQFAIAFAAVEFGGAKLSLFLPWPWLTAVVSVFWFVFVINAINFFDNMDGLASGAIAIAMLCFAVIAIMNRQFLTASAALGVMGLTTGFWAFNRAPATIYLGDSGSHFLGFLTALVTVFVTYFHAGSNSFFPVAAPLVALAPILTDAITVCVIRTLHRKPFWIGDNNHLSHRFTQMGLSRPQAVNCVHMLCFAFGCGALALVWGNLATTAAVITQSAALVGFIIYLQKVSRRA